MYKKSSIVAILYLVLAQVITCIVENTLSLGSNVVIIPGFLSWYKTYNTGAAWSFLQGSQWVIIGITLILGFMILAYEKDFEENTRNFIAFGLIQGGLLSNLLDRLVRGHVIDYIAIQLGTYEYPIFNLADIAIVIGIILIGYAMLKKEDSHGTSSRRKAKN